MKVRLWGVRGSTPTPGRETVRYGGNTCCIDLQLDNGTRIILDCGSGIRALGKSLVKEFAGRPILAHIFLTHFHWDHIQGIPYFVPFYQKHNTFFFYSPLVPAARLRRALEGMMGSPYYPIGMRATRHFIHLGKTAVSINGAVIKTARLNHPQGCAGYRIEADGGVFVLATDAEPGAPAYDRTLRSLARDADLLLYDSQYTPRQSQGAKKGWGHGSWQEGVRIARECDVKRLVLFHHDPDSDDAFVDRLVARAQKKFPNTLGGAEGLEFCLSRGDVKQFGALTGVDPQTTNSPQSTQRSLRNARRSSQ